MGITSFSVTLLDSVIETYKPKTVIELGAQNLYNQPLLPAPYANEYYEANGVSYKCIDISKENNCIEINLSKPYKNEIGTFDLVTDFGTSEHIGVGGKHDIEAFYNCWKTKHELLSVNGIMVNENPKQGNWPGHGFNYVDVDFYTRLCSFMDYKILELGTHPAMGNTTDGWNVFCVFQKENNKTFLTLSEFKKLTVTSK